jgi:hypothetical protein
LREVTWEQFALLASAPVTVALRGRVVSIDPPHVEWISHTPPDSWRIEDEDRHVRFLANESGHYLWPAGRSGAACFQPRRPGYFSSGGMVGPSLVRPRDLLRPTDDDFSRPMSRVEEVPFIGRQAWRVLLAPPARKPQPVWQVLDVISGVTLAYLTTEGVSVAAFTELETDVELPPEAFEVPE